MMVATLALVNAQCLAAFPECNPSLHSKYEVSSALSETASWKSEYQELTQHTDYRLKYVFRLSAQNQTALPVNERFYQNTRYQVSSIEALHLPEIKTGQRLFQNIRLSYRLASGEIREMGNLSYLILNADESVAEVGAGSQALIDEFKNNIFGHEVTLAEQERVFELNRKLYEALSQEPRVQMKLKEFSESRGWNAGFEKEMKLIYFNNEFLDLKAWAKENHFSDQEMKNAGWFERRFDRNGMVKYAVRNHNTIQIPFFMDVEQTKIIAWRTRVLKKVRPDMPKYLSFPLDRARTESPPVFSRLYQSWKLAQAKNKTLVITEGEFKSALATHVSGILTLGLPGITEFDEASMQAVVDANPSEVIIILDRDPKGKALMRLDEVTDSERAAYTIALDLQAKGLKVRVGTLPDVFDGGKVGIDDLILAKGLMPYLETIKQAVSPTVYASMHKLDPVFQELLTRKRKLVQALSRYQDSESRGGLKVSEAVLLSANSNIEKLEAALAFYLTQVKNTDRRLDQPSAQYQFIPQAAELPKALRLRYQSESTAGKFITLSPDWIRANILLMQIPEVALTEISESELTKRGQKIIEMANISKTVEIDQQTLFLAGYLYTIFPLDDYEYNFNAKLEKTFNHERSVSEVIPLMISKKDTKKIVAFAELKNEVTKLDQISNYFRPKSE